MLQAVHLFNISERAFLNLLLSYFPVLYVALYNFKNWMLVNLFKIDQLVKFIFVTNF